MSVSSQHFKLTSALLRAPGGAVGDEGEKHTHPAGAIWGRFSVVTALVIARW